MPKKSRKPIPDAELEILLAIWEEGPGTVRDLLDRLAGEKRAYTTVQTLLTRLERKGYLRSTKDGRSLLYTAVVARQELLSEELQDVATRVAGGRASPLVLNLVEHSELTPADIRELRDLLDRMETKTPKRGKKKS